MVEEQFKKCVCIYLFSACFQLYIGLKTNKTGGVDVKLVNRRAKSQKTEKSTSSCHCRSIVSPLIYCTVDIDITKYIRLSGFGEFVTEQVFVQPIMPIRIGTRVRLPVRNVARLRVKFTSRRVYIFKIS